MLKGLKNLNLPELEEKVLEFWRKDDTFNKSLKIREGAKKFIFYEGPPTANGRPGIHHILARVFKDIIPRYKTMQGFFVARRGGWDTQGLPVEIEVEKELGIKSKPEIEKYGIAEFNKKAKASVWRYKEEWEKFTERIGFWIDFKNAYITYDNKYLEKVWGIIKAVDKRGLLKKFYKVVPWCTRCGTALSSHELAQGYKEVSDTSVYVKFKIKAAKISEWANASIISWTTTPWTLPGNVALAINPKHKFVCVPDPAKKNNWLILELESAKRLGLYDEKSSDIFDGKELVGKEYEPLFKVKSLVSEKSYRVYPADFVTLGEGTGVVHTAVMYGEDDYNLGKQVGLPQHHTVDERGRFTKEVKELAGLYVKASETEKKIIEHLQKNNLLLKTESHKHEYPHCWRCGTPVLYYAQYSWFIEMSRLRKDLVAENNKINWTPAYLKEGRFGEWVKEAKDWAISRERYWGTPLPIWECKDCEEFIVAGDLADLNKFAYQKNEFWIMRHGEATHNIQGLFDFNHKGDKSVLTEKGKKQVLATVQKLAKEKIDVIYCSPFKRAKETAAILKTVIKAPVYYDKRLVEINGGVFMGRPITEWRKFFAVKDDLFNRRPEGGESLSDVRGRVMAALQDINSKHQGKRILVISHGDPLWMIRVGVAGLAKEEIVYKRDESLQVGDATKLDFNNWPYDGEGNLDLHRPYIDEVLLKCPKCGKAIKRVSSVADVWMDSGAMPFASGEYPENYPADYICEAIDQTRGWFYTLLAVGVLMRAGTSYKNVISLGHILDKQGQKMSKSKGNVVDPWAMINKYGTDVLRWYFYTINDPAEPKRFDESDLVKIRNKFHNLLYNSYAFLAAYSPKLPAGKFKNITLLDKWILSRLHQTIDVATSNLEQYDIGGAAKSIEVLIDDLSRWYIRRSRKRPEALPILGKVLLKISKLIAPFTPFFAESLYLSLREMGAETAEDKEVSGKSVHLTNWPRVIKEEINKDLMEQMAKVRHWASLALAKRAEADIRVRQPLAELRVKGEKMAGELLEILADEVNVKTVVLNSTLPNEVELDTHITQELRNEGRLRELVRTVQELRKEGGYQPKDRVELFLEAPKELLVLLKGNKDFKKDINARKIVFSKKSSKKEITADLDGLTVWVGIN